MLKDISCARLVGASCAAVKRSPTLGSGTLSSREGADLSINRRATRFVTCATTVVAAIAMVQCGGSGSPGGPTSATPTVSAVTLNATSVAAGSSAQGTVSLTAAAPTGGANISLSSSNPAVATVQTPLTIQAGTSSVTFTVAAVAAGTATITALLNGNSSQSPMLTVTARPLSVALSSISLSASTVVGGDQVTGTATLTAAAPAGGAVVSLSGGDPLIVPASVVVPAGSASATFIISTRAVGGTIAGTVVGSYGGASASAVLSVTRPTVATASFGVTGPTQSETCTLVNSGNTINCTFNGSTSTAPGTINAWDWSYGVATMFAQTTSGPVLTMPSVDCSLVPPPPLPAVGWLTMIVTLKVHDDLGNVSAEVAHKDVRLLPEGVCGF
jgi:hypothetical protein